MQCLIYSFIKLDPLPKIFLSFFVTLLLVFQTVQLDFLDSLADYSLVIANGFNPKQLILTIYFLFQLLSYVAPPLLSCVSPVKNSHFVILIIDVSDKIIQTNMCAHLSDFVALLVFEIEKVALSLNTVILIGLILPIMYFLL